MFSESSSAKSPRIVPGAESTRVRRAHHRADDRDRRLAADREREHGAGRDEVDERAEERLALVLAVVLARGRLRDLQQPRAAQLEAAALEAGDDLAGEAAAHAVRLDEDEGRFARHAAAESRGGRRARQPLGRRPRAREASTGSPSRSTGRSARATRRAGRTTGRRAGGASCRRAREVRRLDLRAADRAALVVLREPLLHRLDLELALARVLEVLGRPEEHVDDRAEERREEADERRERRRAASRRSGAARP